MWSPKRGLEVYFDYYVRRRTPAIVYAMGRVGSVALFRSLYEHGEFALHAHVLDPDNRRVKKGARPGTSRWAYRSVLRRGRPARIITLVRNPIENMVSCYASKMRARFDPETGYDHVSAEELTDQFKRGYFDQGRHLQQLDWFDTEFRAALGIDVYKIPFPVDLGSVRFREGPLDVLVLDTDVGDPRKAEIVSEFLGLSGLEMLRERVGEHQAYGELYKVFKQRVRVPEEYLDAVVASRFAQHFFSRETLDAMRERFSAAALPASPGAARRS